MWGTRTPHLSLLFVENLRKKKTFTIGDTSTKTIIKYNDQKLYHREKQTTKVLFQRKNNLIIEDINVIIHDRWNKTHVKYFISNGSLWKVMTWSVFYNFCDDIASITFLGL